MIKSKYTITDMKLIANSRNGDCLSNEYKNVDTKLKWICNKSHIWESTPYHIIKRNQWCPTCALEKLGNNKKKTIEDMKELAIKNEGECLSDVYFNSKIKLKWKCKNHHIWESAPKNIIQGSWCPLCSQNLKTDIYPKNRTYS